MFVEEPVAQVIQRSDDILGGTAVFRGTRVPVRTLLDCLGNGQRLDEFLSDFPTVSREQAVAVLELARRALTGDADPPG